MIRAALAVFGAVRLSARLILAICLVMSLTLNIATVTVSGVYYAVSGTAAALGFTTVAAREAGERMARRQAARKAAQRTQKSVSRRLVRQVGRNTAGAFAEAVPVAGVAVIAASLALDIKDSCDTLRELDQLAVSLSGASEADAPEFDCAAVMGEAVDVRLAERVWSQMPEASTATSSTD